MDKNRRIFVYGSLRRQEYNHSRVNNWGFGELKHVADGFIRGAKLYNLGSYPCIVPSENPEDRVVGEVYDVPEELWRRIDGMEQGAGYEAKDVLVQGEDVAIDALAYFYRFGDELSDKQLIPSGDWSKRNEAA